MKTVNLEALLEVIKCHEHNFGPKTLTNSDLIWILSDYLEYTKDND